MTKPTVLAAALTAALALGTFASTAAGASPAALAGNSLAGLAPPAQSLVHFRGHGHWHGGFIAPYGFYYAPRPYSYSYSDDYPVYSGCGWLHHRAVETGSRYWWQRYRACIG